MRQNTLIGVLREEKNAAQGIQREVEVDLSTQAERMQDLERSGQWNRQRISDLEGEKGELVEAKSALERQVCEQQQTIEQAATYGQQLLAQNQDLQNYMYLSQQQLNAERKQVAQEIGRLKEVIQQGGSERTLQDQRIQSLQRQVTQLQRDLEEERRKDIEWVGIDVKPDAPVKNTVGWFPWVFGGASPATVSADSEKGRSTPPASWIRMVGNSEVEYISTVKLAIDNAIAKNYEQLEKFLSLLALQRYTTVTVMTPGNRVIGYVQYNENSEIVWKKSEDEAFFTLETDQRERMNELMERNSQDFVVYPFGKN